MRQTAVEFIESEIKMSDGVLTKGHLLLIIDQVKEMDKESMIQFCKDYLASLMHGHGLTVEEFYNQTFKSE